MTRDLGLYGLFRWTVPFSPLAFYDKAGQLGTYSNTNSHEMKQRKRSEKTPNWKKIYAKNFNRGTELQYH